MWRVLDSMIDVGCQRNEGSGCKYSLLTALENAQTQSKAPKEYLTNVDRTTV